MATVTPKFSYSSMAAKAAPVPEPPAEPIVEPEDEAQPEVVPEPDLEVNSVFSVNKVIIPRCHNNMYSRWNTVKWLCYQIDDNLYNYDYCKTLFKIFMKWIRVNHLEIKIPEYILFAKFISLMYLLSDKRCIFPQYALK